MMALCNRWQLATTRLWTDVIYNIWYSCSDRWEVRRLRWAASSRRRAAGTPSATTTLLHLQRDTYWQIHEPVQRQTCEVKSALQFVEKVQFTATFSRHGLFSVQDWHDISLMVHFRLPWGRPNADHRKRTILGRPFKNDRGSSISKKALRWTVFKIMAWLTGNELVSINVVTLRRARLVPGWVTVFGRVNYRGM